MQVFDENGIFLDMWPTGQDSNVLTHYVTANDYVWVADWETDRMVKCDLDGHYMMDIGEPGPLPGAVRWRAQIHVDQGWQPVRHRSCQRPLAEVPSEGGRRPREARGHTGRRLGTPVGQPLSSFAYQRVIILLRLRAHYRPPGTGLALARWPPGDGKKHVLDLGLIGRSATVFDNRLIVYRLGGKVASARRRAR